MTAFNLAIGLAAGTVLVLGLFAATCTTGFWISEPTICLILGILVGPAVLDLFDPALLPVDWHPVLLEASRVTIPIAVMGAALRLPSGYVRRNLAPLALVLGPGLVLMGLTSEGLATLTPVWRARVPRRAP